MGSHPSPPAAPDPVATSAAQTKMNKETALYQAQLNNVDQITPYGSQTFTQTSGAPQYDMAAYNAAMDRYKAAGINAPQVQAQGGSIQGLPLSMLNGDRTGLANTSASSPAAAAPNMSDYIINDGAAPKFTSTITLSPAEQKILDNQTALQQQQQGIAGTALNQAATNQATPYNLGGLPQLASASNIADAEAAGTADVMRLMQPQMSANDELFRSNLANQGITQGSEAYDHAMLQHEQANNAARSQAALTGVQAGQALQQESLSNNQQAVANYTQQYNAPINEYQALQNGVQVQNPSFAPPQGTQVAPTNYLNAVQQAYQGQLNAYNANTSSNNAMMGGIFGLGGNFLSAAGMAGGFGNLFSSAAALA